MKKRKQPEFVVGDRVKWRSQAQGAWLEKLGTIVEVVAADKMPTKIRHYGRRNHVSYVVEVNPNDEANRIASGRSGRRVAKLQHYWPIASKLMRVRKATT